MKHQELITKELILECMGAKKRIKKSGFEFLLEKENNIMLVYKDDKLIEPVNVELPDLEAEAKKQKAKNERELELKEWEEKTKELLKLEKELRELKEESKKDFILFDKTNKKLDKENNGYVKKIKKLEKNLETAFDKLLKLDIVIKALKKEKSK